MNEQKNNAYHQPDDRERIEDALENEFQWSVLNQGRFIKSLTGQFGPGWLSGTKPLKEVFVRLFIISGSEFCSDRHPAAK